jgi:hypothetical protein
MRYLSLYTPAAFVNPTPEYQARMMKFMEESTRSGVLITTGGFCPGTDGVRVRSTKGKFAVTDGPFTEAKEVIGGFALLECKSREEAIEMSRRFLAVAGDGECEVHQLMDGPPPCTTG